VQDAQPLAGLSPEATALKASFDQGDRSQWEALMAPGCMNWHNTDKQEVPAAGFGGASTLTALVENLRADIVQDQGFPGGRLIRLVIRGLVRSTGRELEAHNCIVLTTTESGITRIEDYVDPSLMNSFRPDVS
jgi:ketosteroid isomerase-like protein